MTIKISALYKVFLFIFLVGAVVSCTPKKVDPLVDNEEIVDDGEDEEGVTPPDGEETVVDTIDPVDPIDPPEPEEPVLIEIAADGPDFTWKNWYLSVPIDRSDGSATSIFYETITNDTLTTDEKGYFYKNSDDSYTLYTKFTGYTTSGLKEIDGGGYCRTELREFWQGVQSTDENWYMSAGTIHILESTLKVESCEGSKGLYVAQIHGKASPTITTGSSPATVKVRWYDNDLEIEYYKAPENSSSPWTSDDIIKKDIGTVNNSKFTIKIKVDDGKLYYGLVCEDTGIDKDYELLYDYLDNGYDYSNYFKTGNYFKHNADYIKSSQVRLYSVKTAHSL